jgi:hypothetical protein
MCYEYCCNDDACTQKVNICILMTQCVFFVLKTPAIWLPCHQTVFNHDADKNTCYITWA